MELRFEESKKIIVNKFQCDEISYAQKHFSDSMELNKYILGNYTRSIKRYIKLFRSGPDSQKRTFTFIFILNIYNENQTKDLIKFIYPLKKKPKVIDLIRNEDLIEQILKYIEMDFLDEKMDDIKDIIEKINIKLNKQAPD